VAPEVKGKDKAVCVLN